MAIKPAPTAVYRQVICEMIRQEGAERVVEVGVHGGGLSRLIAAEGCVKQLWLVDPWTAYKHYDDAYMQQRYEEVKGWAANQKGVEVMRMTSASAQGKFEENSIDFFHTDGDHHYHSVLQDIALWGPKVRPGGLITGDNYEYEPIARAANELLPNLELAANGRIFWARK